MKLSRLETHDRLLHLKKDQSLNISQGAEDCMKKNALSLALQEKSPYIYIFAHPRTAEDGVNKRMLWQPRLSKPEAQENSYLFRAQSKTDIIEVCWLIPPKDMWKQYQKGNVTEHEVVNWSINQLLNNKKGLELPDPDDMPETQAKTILKRVIQEKMEEIRIKKMYPKQALSEAFQFLPSE